MFVSVTLSCLSPCTFVYLSVRYVCLPCLFSCAPMSFSVLFLFPVFLHALLCLPLSCLFALSLFMHSMSLSVLFVFHGSLSLSLLALLCLPLSCLFVLSLSIHSYVCLCSSAFGLPMWCMFVSACVVCFGLSRHRPLYNCIELYYTDVCGLGHSLRLI